MPKATGESRRNLAGLSVLMLLLPGCGVSDGLDRLKETIDETLEDSPSPPDSGATATFALAEPEWAEYANEAGLFIVALPAEPDYVAIEWDGVTANSWSTRSGADSYVIGESPLQPGATYDFDAGVDRAVERVVDSIEEQLGRPAVYEMVDEHPDVRNGHVGVRFVAAIAVEDNPYATVNGAVYDTGDLLVFLTMIDLDSDNADGAQRFIESLDFVS